MRKIVSFFFILLCFVGIATTLIHLLEFQPIDGNSLPPGEEWYKIHLKSYKKFSLTTHLHLIAAMIFMLIAPFQFWSNFRNKHMHAHKVLGLIFILLAILTGVTGVTLGFVIPFSGAIESVIAFSMGGFLLFSIYKAVGAIRRKKIQQHREWMLRAFSAGSSVATMRVLNAILFPFNILGDRDLFWISLLLGLSLNISMTEAWIRYTRIKPHQA